jgi:hypothetical protein
MYKLERKWMEIFAYTSIWSLKIGTEKVSKDTVWQTGRRYNNSKINS